MCGSLCVGACHEPHYVRMCVCVCVCVWQAQKQKEFWRGMQNLELTEEFRLHGGTELGCMSTSEQKHVVAQFAQSAKPLVFRVGESASSAAGSYQTRHAISLA